MAAPAPHPWSGFATGTSLVAVTYAFFLLFAQFAFVQLVRDTAAGAFVPIMAAQGIGGLAGSFFAAWLFRPERARALLAAAFLLASSVAAVAPSASGTITLGALSLATGLAIGTYTVVVATSLRDLVGRSRLGWACGLGTGLAYSFCSWPAVFLAAPDRQSLLAAGLALAGAAFATTGAPSSAVPRQVAEIGLPAQPDAAALNKAAWLLVFFALVAFDSAAFFIIQHTPGLKAAAWSGETRQYFVAASHLVAGLAAAGLLAQGRSTLIPTLAFVAIAGASLALGRPADWISVLYAAGVSLYSVALVFYPASRAQPRLTALVYAVCGWTGSAVGLGLAQGRTDVPTWLIVATGLLVGAGLLRNARQRARAFRHG